MANPENTTTIARGNKRMTITVRPGFTLEQVLALMNRWEANVLNNEIVSFPEGGANGWYTLADITAVEDGREFGEWAVLGNETRQCAGTCSGCGCRCACTSDSACCRV